MTGRTALLEVLGDLEKVRDELFALFRSRPQGWKQRYLATRSGHQAELLKMYELSDRWLATEGDTPRARRFRELLTRWRSTLADHRSRWPVINIDPDDPDYQASMAAIDAARLEIVSFVRTHMTD